MPDHVAELGLTQVLVVIVAWASLSCLLWAVVRRLRGRTLLPEGNPVAVPWGVGSVWTVFLLWVLVITLSGTFVSAVIRSGMPPAASENTADARTPPWLPIWQITATALANGVLVVLVPAWLRATVGARLDQLGLTARAFGRNLLRGFFGCLVIIPLVYAVAGLANLVWPMTKHPMQGMLQLSDTPAIMALAVVAGVLLAPVVEELMFRAVLQGWLTRALRGWAESDQLAELLSVPPEATLEPAAPAAGLSSRVAPRLPSFGLGIESRIWLASVFPNLLTSLLFAGIHYEQWPAPLALFPLSLALGFVYNRTGSLVGPITMHATFNAISTLLLFSSLV